MKTFSVLMVTKRRGWRTCLERNIIGQTIACNNVIIVEEGVNAPKKTRKSNLNASLNAGLKQVKTEFVIFYQDFIDLNPNCFAKLLELADEETFVTTCTKNPAGKIEDPRYLGVDGPRPCMPEEWEANVGIAPMKAVIELGGFDEEYDDGWSWDNVNLAERAAMLGYKFILDESNRPQLLPHPPAHKDGELEPNGEFHVKRMQEIRDGKRSIRCNYLV
jgi:hypothetical protein